MAFPVKKLKAFAKGGKKHEEDPKDEHDEHEDDEKDDEGEGHGEDSDGGDDSHGDEDDTDVGSDGVDDEDGGGSGADDDLGDDDEAGDSDEGEDEQKANVGKAEHDSKTHADDEVEDFLDTYDPAEDGNPPPGINQEIWNDAKDAAEPKWNDYDEPYSVVAYLYKQLGGEFKGNSK